MITQIKGRLIEKTPTYLVIDCNGIGYEVNISLNTFSSISSEENIQLFTHLQIREDAHILYGFFTVAERTVFRLLISISGIGTSTARTIFPLSHLMKFSKLLLQKMFRRFKELKGLD